jgi:hypothetical protein
MSLERRDDAEDFFCNAVSMPFVVESHTILFSGFLVKVFIGRGKKSALESLSLCLKPHREWYRLLI